jgi:hypothetical protein
MVSTDGKRLRPAATSRSGWKIGSDTPAFVMFFAVPVSSVGRGCEVLDRAPDLVEGVIGGFWIDCTFELEEARQRGCRAPGDEHAIASIAGGDESIVVDEVQRERAIRGDLEHDAPLGLAERSPPPSFALADDVVRAVPEFFHFDGLCFRRMRFI